jgi:hypothetical protein
MAAERSRGKLVADVDGGRAGFVDGGGGRAGSVDGGGGRAGVC